MTADSRHFDINVGFKQFVIVEDINAAMCLL